MSLSQLTIFNQSANSTAARTFLFDSQWATVLVAAAASLMALTTIVGNVLVITAFAIDKSLRTYSNYFILNLSIADLCIGALIPPYIPFLLFNYTWRLGRAACVAWLVFDYVVGSASVLCIVAISLDRYLLVSRGLSYLSKQRRCKTMLLMGSVWLVAFLNYGPAIILWDLLKSSPSQPSQCYVGFADNIGYLTASACVEFFFPLVSICSLNLAVYMNIRRRSRGLISHSDLAESVHSASSSRKIQQMADKIRQANHNIKMCPTPSGAHSLSRLTVCEASDRLLSPEPHSGIQRLSSSADSSRGDHLQVKARSLSKDKKAARFLFIIVLTFGFCWVTASFAAAVA